MNDIVYWGCIACGHESTQGNPCWECEHDRYMTWLDEHGEPVDANWRLKQATQGPPTADDAPTA